MQWWRRRTIRKPVAGLALALTVLHVAFLSLHVAMMAALAFAGDAAAAQQGKFGFVLCAPAKTAAAEQAAIPGTTDTSPGNATATFCPVCTGATSPILILPELPVVPAYVALFAPLPTAETPAPRIGRHEAQPKQSRAPPQLT
ncbi:MAG: hypothetical protein KDJ47_10245 [Hyphomicrobiaceae bacterium]|nr:hypothetical protein [Hyphomicrobiaceae bacterium]